MANKKAWKSIETLHYPQGCDYVSHLLKKGYRVSEWIQDIFSEERGRDVSFLSPMVLSRVTVSDFGFREPVALQEIYEAFPSHGYALVPPEVALHCRLIYDEQPAGEWLRFATPMGSMIDSDGVPHLPKLGKALGLFFIETYWAYEQAVFHPHNEFVVAIR